MLLWSFKKREKIILVLYRRMGSELEWIERYCNGRVVMEERSTKDSWEKSTNLGTCLFYWNNLLVLS